MVWLAAGGGLLYGGCSAHGNDVDPSAPEGDGGPRRVIVNDPGKIDGAVAYDAATLFDGGSKTDGAAPDDGGPVSLACGFITAQPGGTCPTATDLGSVSGDTDPAINTIKYTGTGSSWLFFEVTEDSSSVSRNDLSVGLKLTGPAGTNYDLYGYVDPSGTKTSRACATVTGQSNNAAGTDDQVRLGWNDSNFSSDTRLVSIRIEHVSGPCGPTDGWSLEVLGHAP